MYKEITDIQLARGRLLENREWIDENILEIQKKYSGKWIAVINKEIAAEGETPDDVRQVTIGKENEALIIKVPAFIATPM